MAYTNKKTILDRLSFALGVSKTQIDDVVVKPAVKPGVVQNTEIQDVVTYDLTCRPFSEFLNKRSPSSRSDDPLCNDRGFLGNLNDWPCVCFSERRMFPNVPGDDRMEVTITCVDSLSENAAKFFKNDGVFDRGVFKRVCEYVTSGIKSGCLSPNPLLMTEYKDKIRHFSGSDNPWFGVGDNEMRVFDGLFDKAHEEDDSSCQICLRNSLYTLDLVLREFKLFFLVARPDLAGTIFDKGAYDKFWRDLWREIIACVMNAVEAGGAQA
jgi:hypothetical protein